MDQGIADASQLIHTANTVLVVTHIRPDGDAIGSLLGIGLALESAGKSVQMVCSDSVPSTFRFLQGSDKIRTQVNALPGGFDLVISVDASEISRVGTVLDGLPQPQLNIDHHITNTRFALVNLVEPDAVACAEMLALLIPEVGLEITQPVAEALLTGLLTDTIGFRTNNMTTRALHVAAVLMDNGANLPRLYKQVLLQHSFSAIKFWGSGLSQIQRDGRLVWTILTMEERKQAGYSGRDDADLINVLSSIRDVDIAIVFVEQPDGGVKVSWRAFNGYDVSAIAQFLGGGGHRAAAGAILAGPLTDVMPEVLKLTKELLFVID